MSEVRKLLSYCWCGPEMVENIDGCEDGAYVITEEEMLELINLIKKESQPTIADHLKANEAMLTKTKAKMVSIESLKEFAGIK